ncbi:ribonuclease H-like domain-containing protein [Anaerosphaera multitolerans]|uniref:YprB ribonuclease H-like domain-containing protein n=1 Tax=Anaerosphaera multitolerans TaxID=2487351 RepID=A0A437S7G9_9FIRM|nr:ribonuclease H-like domain-containing protein [Anaerosphaera multitolerans]RVU54881.1 hypothetical protein EF514_04655 [Anaerosphaera multitolerans]
MREYIFDFNIKDKFILNNFKNHIALDIETTGLSRKKDSIFLICTCEIKESTELKLLFADDLKEEIEILQSIKLNNKNIITYNGQSFDVPFIKERKQIYKIPNDNILNFDLYRYLTNYKFLLNLKNYKQKTVEEFLNINRDEFTSGGNIVELYKNYLVDKDEIILNEIITHNKDDVSGLVQSLKILEILDNKLSLNVKDESFKIENIIFDKNFLIIKGNTSVNTSLYYNLFNYSFIVEDKNFIIEIETEKNLYKENVYCNYVQKSNFQNLENISGIPSPKDILILSTDKIIYDNIQNLVRSILEKHL